MFSRDGIDIYREKNTTRRAVDEVAAGQNGELRPMELPGTCSRALEHSCSELLDSEAAT